jgi:hypothetical protein
MIVKVDVQPLAAGRAGTIRGDGYQLCPDPAPADPGSHESVEQEGVDTPVPGKLLVSRPGRALWCDAPGASVV